ncbi:MAG: TIGR03663 family protein [Chloroflexota bacterium]
MTEQTQPIPETPTDFLDQPLARFLALDWYKIIYVLFIILAIVSRFADLGSRVVSHDESLHTQYAYQYYNGDGYMHTPLMHGPFLFHATALSYWLLGDNDFTARIPVAILGILLVVMPYYLRNWLGDKGAIFASFFFLVSPYLTYYSRYIRHDIYVIVWAMIAMIAMWHYLEKRRDKYLWWFVVGTVLMFCTKEVSFIYVAIFGSYLVVRLAVQILGSAWFYPLWPNLRSSILILAIAALLGAGGFVGQELVTREAEPTVTTTPDGQTFAADPTEQIAAGEDASTSNAESIMRWLQVLAIFTMIGGLVLAAHTMRPHIDDYPEFDLIILFATLLLPSIAPMFSAIVGWPPNDYTFTTCATLDPVCIQAFLASGLARSLLFVAITGAVGIAVGFWWDARRWLIAAVIFHSIFLVLFTSVFTNPGGWMSGTVGSLGYWIEQHEVQRGSQPWFYYLFVMPFYEFMVVTFSITAIGLWLRFKQLNRVVGYWIGVMLLALLAYSLVHWLFNRTALTPEEMSQVPGLLSAVGIVLVSILIWFLCLRHRLAAAYNLEKGVLSLFRTEQIREIVPFLVWWAVFTWLAYSIAGEKMPWLSTHFVIPMGLLAGWYFHHRLNMVEARAWLERQTWLGLGLSILLLLAFLLAIGPLLLGQVRLGGQEASELAGIGRFLGGLIVTGIIFYFWQGSIEKMVPTARRVVAVLAIFILLSVLTVRFSYMANFVNADYTTEFLVYAHGGPATKEAVLDQIDTLSHRLHGDNSIRVAYDNDTSWPYTWYLRPSQYPNRQYFGESPNNSLTEFPAVLVGARNFDRFDPFLSRDYTYQTYTFLWWPMEDYRRFSWNAILGDPHVEPENRRGLGNANVRQAIWDIFFYRDYTRYGQVFGGTYRPGEWPLRHQLRLYIRNDMMAQLWDRGVGAVSLIEQLDPYAEGELSLSPNLILNETGLNAPRNVAVSADGRIYAADSGNHQIQVFDADGRFLTSWGEFGSGPGALNEPWGIAVDDSYVYVADTWNHRLQKFTLDGAWVSSFGRSGSAVDEPETAGLGLFFGPRDLLLLPNNQLLVTDAGNHRLQLLDRDGNFLRVMGQLGNRPAEFNEPIGLGLGPDGTIAVMDTWNGRVQQFTLDLFPINEWNIQAWAGQSINNKPYVAIDNEGRLYITDPEGYRILIFGPNGNYLGRFGQFGSEMDRFDLPTGIAIDSQNNLYIADAGNNRIVRYEALFGAPLTPPVEEIPEESPEEAPIEEPVEDIEDNET